MNQSENQSGNLSPKRKDLSPLAVSSSFTPEVKQRFVELLKDWLPVLTNSSLVSDRLISPFAVELPPEEYANFQDQAQDLVQSLWELRNSAAWQNKIRSLETHSSQTASDIDLLFRPGSSVCMSADVHWHEGQLKLIEINTNAAFLALGFILKEAWGEATSPSWPQQILKMFQSSRGKPFKKVAIVDENPSQQKLFVEFLLYQKIFNRMGLDCDIQDSLDVQKNMRDGSDVKDLTSYDLIYNRSTDFLLSHSPRLRAAQLSTETFVTPSPLDYLLLARKSNLALLSQTDIWSELQLSDKSTSILRSHLLESCELKASNSTKIWQERKKWFLKPAQSYGSKQAYRGASISFKLFASLIDQGFVAQSFAPAPEITITGPKTIEEDKIEKEEKLKWDARIFFFEGQVQLILVRLYQGQVTNLSSPLGGWSILRPTFDGILSRAPLDR